MSEVLSRDDIGLCLQINKDHCYVDHSLIGEYVGDDVSLVTREEAIKLFNDIEEANGYTRLTDPTGYMTLDDSIYNSIKDSYDIKYEEKLNQIANGEVDSYVEPFIYSLNKIRSPKRDNMVVTDMNNFLPKGYNFRELRFLHTNPEIDNTINDLVDARIEMTLIYSKKRSYTADQFKEAKETFFEKGKELVDQIMIEDQQQALFNSTLDNVHESTMKNGDNGLVL